VSSRASDKSSNRATKARAKSVEERVGHSVGQRTRAHVLTLLNEGTYTTAEIAAIIGERPANVKHHIQQLLATDSIELAHVEKAGNTNRHYYRAVKKPYYSDEDLAAMSPEERQELIGLTLQCAIAEVMSAFWAGNMSNDPRFWLSWRWFNVDEQGRQDLADELQSSWERVQEIEVESTNRRSNSDEPAQSVVIASTGFRRERTAPSPPTGFKGNAS